MGILKRSLDAHQSLHWNRVQYQKSKGKKKYQLDLLKKMKGEEESRQRHVMNALPSKLTPLGESIAVAVTQGQKKSTQSIKALPLSISIELRGYEEYQQEERCGWVPGRFWSLAGLFCSAEKGRFLAWLPHVRSHGSLPVGSDAMTKESHSKGVEEIERYVEWVLGVQCSKGIRMKVFGGSQWAMWFGKCVRENFMTDQRIARSDFYWICWICPLMWDMMHFKKTPK